MKCIVMEREYGRLGAGRTYLVNSENYAPLFEGGGTLTITAAGYKLTNKAGEIIQRGKETDGIAIVKTLSFDIELLEVVDEMNGVSLQWEEYKRKFAHGEIFRNKARRFYVVAIKDEQQSATVFGITEKANGYTHAIHSLFVSETLNRYERSQFVTDYIAKLLYADEFANVQGKGVGKPHVMDWRGKEHIRVFSGIQADTNAEECGKLALDALERKESVTETFKEPIKYKKDEESKGSEEIEKEETTK